MSRAAPSIQALRSSDPEERRRATSELAEFDPELVADQVALALADEDWRVRKEAVAVAIALGPSEKMLGYLIGAFFPSDNVGFRNAAVEAMGGFGQATVDALSEVMPQLDADGRKLAAEALGKVARGSALDVLQTLLSDADPNVRVAAVEALASIGSAGMEEVALLLKPCLTASEPLVALAALEGLNSLGVALNWPTVEGLLAMPGLRRSSLLAAGRTGAPEAVPVLLQAVAESRGWALGEAVCALRELLREARAFEHLREHARQLAPAIRHKLVDLLKDENTREPVRRASFVLAGALGLTEAADACVSGLGDDYFLAEAHEGLSLLGSAARDALIRGTQNPDALVRAGCFGLLARLKDSVAPSAVLSAARRAIAEDTTEVRAEALAVIAEVGDESCLQDVIRCLAEESSPEARLAAESSLRQLSLRHPEQARLLLEQQIGREEFAHAACVMIAAFGKRLSEIPGAIVFLSSALSHSSADVRRAAIEGLADVDATSSVDSIAFALGDEEHEVRQVAIAALGRVRAIDGSAPGVRHLMQLVQAASEPELVAAAARALGEAGDAHGLPVLKPLTRSPHPFVAVSAIEALAVLAGPRRLDALLDGLAHADAEVVKATLLALSEAEDPRVVAHIGACLDNEAWDVRRLAADLLGHLPGEPAHGLLRARLVHEESPPVQAAISRALERGAGLRKSSPPGSNPPR